MRRKYLATLAVVTALITSVVPVYADYSKAGDTGSQEISSSFDVSADDFGGLIVSIPNDIPLSYDKESNLRMMIVSLQVLYLLEKMEMWSIGLAKSVYQG